LIADDQALVRAGFRMVLETDPDIMVVAEAVEASRRADVDVVLLDIRMPGMDRPGESPRVRILREC
jgi:DNA-binding NarL/FixJ family response regulator